MKGQDETYLLKSILALMVCGSLYSLYKSLDPMEAALFITAIVLLAVVTGMFLRDRYSKDARDRRTRLERIRELPLPLVFPSPEAVLMGRDQELDVPIYLPDAIRTRHVHIIGATGSGKTESVILNFLRQDVARGFGSIILDAKGEMSFLRSLKEWVPPERLRVFDLSSAESLTYNPLSSGSPLEAAQRLFSSLTWSEEYYATKALAALQTLFQIHHGNHGRNPSLVDLSYYLQDPKTYGGFVQPDDSSEKVTSSDYSDLSGLIAQIRILCTAHLAEILSPKTEGAVQLSEAFEGKVIYFRLQSLLSSQLVSTIGKMIINHLNFLAGQAHRTDEATEKHKLVPTYLDEFASFACPEFSDLVSKARSAGFALHFSHQSTGDVAEVSKGFLNQITDNSATKIVMRINDPESAEFFARSFGTKLYQKVTHRITNAKEMHTVERIGEGSQREAHQFRASPDLFKTLPTGVGSVLIAHGHETPHGASTVFKIKFPLLNPNPSPACAH